MKTKLTLAAILGLATLTGAASADPAFLDWRDARRAYCHHFANAYQYRGSEELVLALDYCRKLSNVEFAAYTGVAMPLTEAETVQATELVGACFSIEVDGGYTEIHRECDTTEFVTEPMPIEQAVTQARRTDACAIEISSEGWSVVYDCPSIWRK